MVLPFVCASLPAQDTATVDGTVTDAVTHQKLAGVRVLADVNNTVFSAVSASDGSYVLHALPPGELAFTVTKTGYREINATIDPGHAVVTVNAGETTTFDFALTSAPSISGRIVDYETEDPVKGLSVVPLQEDYGTGVKRFIRAVAGAAVTDNAGAFELTSLEPGAYFLQIGQSILEIAPGDGRKKNARRAEYGRSYFPDAARIEAALPVTLAAGESRSLEIKVRKRRPRSVSGDVEAPEGDHAEKIQLTLTAMQAGAFTLIAHGELEHPGPFHIDHLSEGEYVLTAEDNSPSKERGLFAQCTVDVNDGDAEDLKLLLEPGFTVEGSVRIAEENLELPSKLSVQLWPVTVSANAEPVAVSESGRFRLDGVSRGGYFPRLMGLSPGYALTEVRYRGAHVAGGPIRVDHASPDSTLNFIISTRVATVTGTVRDTKGAVMKDVRIVLLPEALPDMMDSSALRYVNSGENGQFAFTDLAPGRYKAVALIGPLRRSHADLNLLRSKSATADAFEVQERQIFNLELTPPE